VRRVDGRLSRGENSRRVVATPENGGLSISFDGAPPEVFSIERDDDARMGLRDASGRAVRGAAVRDGRRVLVVWRGRAFRFDVSDGAAKASDAALGAGPIRAPMTGKIVDVLIREGDVVAAGTPLLVLEAMKMEHRMTAPVDAVVKKLSVKVGDAVEMDAALVELAPKPKDDA
jgi:acetyl-CoA/propionyl-CoA carboxylase, biotin carboxylase, biotin carboxyl carrier protein